MKVVYNEERQFEPISLVMQCRGDLEKIIAMWEFYRAHYDPYLKKGNHILILEQLKHALNS